MGLPVTSRRKVGMTSSQHGLYVQGYTRGYNGRYRGKQDREVEQILKTVLSSDCRLQFACMKLELLVIADQQRRGECVLGSCTHRPSHHESWWRQKSLV